MVGGALLGSKFGGIFTYIIPIVTAFVAWLLGGLIMEIPAEIEIRKKQKLNKRLIDGGKIIIRDKSFVKHAETFELNSASYSKVCEEIRKLLPFFQQYNIEVKTANGAEIILFEIGRRAEAKLMKAEKTAETDSDVYGFFITKFFELSNGDIEDITNINIVLTAIEKIFSKLDPQVVRAFQEQTTLR